MGFLESVKAWFKTEAAEAQDVRRGMKSRMEADLARRENELAMTPEERLDQMTESIEGDTSIDDLRDKIEGRGALADAAADVSEIDAAQRDGAEAVDGPVEDSLDLESDEIDPPETPPAR